MSPLRDPDHRGVRADSPSARGKVSPTVVLSTNFNLGRNFPRSNAWTINPVAHKIFNWIYHLTTAGWNWSVPSKQSNASVPLLRASNMESRWLLCLHQVLHWTIPHSMQALNITKAPTPHLKITHPLRIHQFHIPNCMAIALSEDAISLIDTSNVEGGQEIAKTISRNHTWDRSSSSPTSQITSSR